MADMGNHAKNIKGVFGFDINEPQLRSISSWLSNKHLFLNGTAGSGKTWIAIYLAVNSILKSEQTEMIVVRSLVPTRNIGFLPGSVNEKTEPYLQIYTPIIYEALSCFTGKNKNTDFIKDRVKFENTSFLRGKTWDNTVVYIDEVQNLSSHELHTVMTRVGKNSRVIISGDYFQSDLKASESCFLSLEDAISELDMFEEVAFYSDDIVRSDFVRSWCEVFEPLISK